MEYASKSSVAEQKTTATTMTREALEAVEKLHARLHDVVNSICGSRPEEVAGNGPTPPINGALDGIRRDAGAIFNLASSMQAMLTRLEGEF